MSSLQTNSQFSSKQSGFNLTKLWFLYKLNNHLSAWASCVIKLNLTNIVLVIVGTVTCW